MDALTVDSVYGALLVLLAICGAIATIGKAIDTINGWRKPQRDAKSTFEAMTQKCEKRFENDNRRFERGEERMAKIEEELDDFHQGQFHTCMCLKALLNHELHNGNSEEMIEAASNMDKWLVKRRL